MKLLYGNNHEKIFDPKPPKEIQNPFLNNPVITPTHEEDNFNKKIIGPNIKQGFYFF